MSGIIDLTSPNHNDNNDANQNHVNNGHHRPTNNNNNNNNHIVNKKRKLITSTTEIVKKRNSDHENNSNTIIHNTTNNWIISSSVSMIKGKLSDNINVEKQNTKNQLFVDINFQANSRSIDGRSGMKKKSNNNSDEAPKCYCGKHATAKRVRKETQNKGKYFYCCNKPAKFRCKFFQWCNGEPHTKQAKDLSWKRFSSPEYKLAQTHLLNEKLFAPNDILQGKIGDCWFISAAAVVAERSDLMQQIFSYHLNNTTYLSDNNNNNNNNDNNNIKRNMCIPKDGKLVINLCLHGEWEAISIDNFLPIRVNNDKKANGNNSSTSSSSSSTSSSSSYRKLPKSNLAFAKPGRGNSLWLAFLEKAYAKACSNYMAISGGEIVEAFSVLTGCPTEVLSLNDEHFDSDIAWGKLLSYASCNFPMGAGTLTTGEGIVGLHAYSILEVKEIKDVKLGRQQSIKEFFSSSKKKSSTSAAGNTSASVTNQFHSNGNCYDKQKLKDSQNVHLSLEGTLRVLRIRNPWGKKEWHGAFSSGSDVWTNSLKKILKMTDKNDGTFWITYTDFMRRFTNVDVVKAHKNWYNVTFKSSKIQNMHNTRGMNFIDSNVVEMRVHQVTWTQICLFLPNTRGRKDYSYNSKNDVTIVITKHVPSNGNGSKNTQEEVLVVKSNTSITNQDHVELILDDTNATYRIYFLRYNRSVQIDYIWKILSANPISARQIILSEGDSRSFQNKFRDMLFKTIQCGITSHQGNIFNANVEQPRIYSRILNDTTKLEMLCCGKIGYISITNLSMVPIDIIIPSFMSGINKNNSSSSSSSSSSSGTNHTKGREKGDADDCFGSKYIWIPDNKSVVNVKGLEKRFIFISCMYDEILFNDGTNNINDGNYLLIANENTFVTSSSMVARYNMFLNQFNVIESSTITHKSLSSESNQISFFDSVSLLS